MLYYQICKTFISFLFLYSSLTILATFLLAEHKKLCFHAQKMLGCCVATALLPPKQRAAAVCKLVCFFFFFRCGWKLLLKEFQINKGRKFSVNLLVNAYRPALNFWYYIRKMLFYILFEQLRWLLIIIVVIALTATLGASKAYMLLKLS